MPSSVPEQPHTLSEIRSEDVSFEGLETTSLRALIFSRVPSRFIVGLITLVSFAGLLISPPVEVREAPAGLRPLVAKLTPAVVSPSPPPRARGARVSRAPAGDRVTPEPALVRPAFVPDLVVSGSLIHTVRRGESVTSIARQYLGQTVFMTVAELDSAIRRVNGGKCERSIAPGDQVMIPGYEPGPIVERSRPVSKDYEVRAIYLTGLMAGSKRGIDLIRRWRELGGNAIVFDVKDSDGSVSVPFGHPLAPRHRPYIQNLPKFTRFLHSLGLHAIARVTLFRDELLARHHPELAVWSRRGNQPWRENGKLVWVDPSRPEVQEYNLALAKHVANSGVDEIQFDYVRFPAEGEQKDAKFHFQTGRPEWERADVITDFLARTYSELHALGVLVSLDVFGVMAWQRPVDLAHTGQDIVSMARHCDVLSPMIYPSHFFGMDGYARPGDAPEHFIRESMKRFQEITRDTGVVLRPWLQAFAWRTRTYSPSYIVKQVNVAKEKDGIGYLFWNARNDYSKPFIAMAELRAMPRRAPSSPEAEAPASGEVPPAVPAPERLPAPPAESQATGLPDRDSRTTSE